VQRSRLLLRLKNRERLRELRVRADVGFGYDPVLAGLEQQAAEHAVVARLTPSLKRVLRGLRYQGLNARWEIAEGAHRPRDWKQPHRCVVGRRRLGLAEPEPTLFHLERYLYRAWITNWSLSAPGVWHFYGGCVGMKPRIRELREDFALRRIPARSFAANALYLEVVRPENARAGSTSAFSGVAGVASLRGRR
jgi:hypothetical protein